jgi:hypothetical protein
LVDIVVANENLQWTILLMSDANTPRRPSWGPVPVSAI